MGGCWNREGGMEMSQRISVAQAAGEIGCDREYLRRKMQTGEWDLGSYIKPKRGQKKGTYFIFRGKLDKFLGIADSGTPMETTT